MPFLGNSAELTFFPEQVYEYKSGLVDRLNEQMSTADDEVNQKMDDLSEHLNNGLDIIDRTAEPFRHGIADDRLQVNDGTKSREEVILSAVMADLEGLMETKSKRLEELAVEYARVQQQITALAIAVLGEEMVSFADVLNGKDQAAKVGCYIQENAKGTGTGQTQYGDMEQVCQDTVTGLEELQSKLDDLVLRNLAENKEAVKVRKKMCLILTAQSKVLTRLAGISRKPEVKTRRNQ